MDKFYLGMDIGTNSVGMACTDEEYSLLRANGKDCWAVRLFDESETAVKRRNFRTARRRIVRRRERIKFLQGVFAPFIADETFFMRLNDSQYYPEDKNGLLNGNKNNLFADKGYTDKDFHKEYPTIFHLRKALMTQPTDDLRLYYLAIHHIIKYRGHFLFEGGMADIRDITKLIENLNAVCGDLFDEDAPDFDVNKSHDAKEILLTYGKDKPKRLENLFGITSQTGKEIIKGICGYTIKPEKLFAGNYQEEKSFSFKDLTDETFEAMRPAYADDFSLLESIRAIYNFVTFEKLLEGKEDISSAMIDLYEKHKADLRLLKDFVLNSATREEYNSLFKVIGKENNYAKYVGFTKKGGDKKKITPAKYDDFLAYLKKFINSLTQVNDEETKEKILSEIEAKTFLPKILHADNGLFPHQVNEDELNKILTNMVKIHPETECIKDKIKKIFLYRIPYFVGPLAGANGWAVRKAEGKITPWNFDEIIDKAQSNENFMRRMTNKCSYLYGEDVLPKASIIYQKYNVLNQINKLKINDEPISVALKQDIFNQLFLTKKKVTDNSIKDLLVRRGIISEEDKKTIIISGKDGQLNATMSSYLQLKDILGDFVDEDIQKEDSVCEKIILWHTLNTDKNIVVDLIERNFGKIPTIKDNLKQLKGLVFKDFGRLSKRFLIEMKGVDKTTGEFVSILDVLYETNENLNQILFDERYNFGDVIKEENGEKQSEIKYEDIEKLYVSPAVRRGIWQSLKMADEYIQAIGKTPDKIFIEVTREDGVKGDLGRKSSRQKQLSEKYKAIDNIELLTESLNSESDLRLRQERLYLYYRQLGKCMYSGEQIDLDSLNTNQYDVDHILPRTYIKDDSLDNKVLVKRSCNAIKTDRYPIPDEILGKDIKKHWDLLHKKDLISDTTYNRLTRTKPLDEDDYNDFINRQKTITDQTAKAVAELLKQKYPDTKIVYSKAKNVSDFKSKVDLVKCRETNDLHHAKDAYLNIVVGNVYDTCFSTPMSMFRQDGDKWRTYNLKTLFFRNIKGAWTSDDNKTLIKVKETYKKQRSINVTRYTYCGKGAFYDQTVYPHDDTGVNAPRKSGSPLKDCAKYGGYKSQKTAYFAIVESEGKKGKIIKRIEVVPVLVTYNLKNNPNAVQEYFESYLTNPKILVPKLKIKQLIKYNGMPCYLAGSGDENRIKTINALQMFTDGKTDEYVNALLKVAEMDKNQMCDKDAETYLIKTNRFKEVKLEVNKQNNIALYDKFINKLSSGLYVGISAFSSVLEILQKAREKFTILSTLNQSLVLLQILKLFKCNAELLDLSLINGGKNVGLLRISRDITKAEVVLVNQSPCGLTLREQKI